MARKTEIIIVEDEFRDMFLYLPDMLGSDGNLYTPTFKIGDHKELLAFFAQSNGSIKYPLIWLERPFSEVHHHNKVKLQGANLIVAIQTNTDLTDRERMDLTFKPTLIPLTNNIINLFRVANTIDVFYPYTITKYPNYSDVEAGEQNGFVDIWDAVRINFDCTINDSCLRQIKI